MADIAFLLMVYFMVTTTFTAFRGLDFALPEAEEEPRAIEPVESVLVEVGSDGGLRVDGQPMELPGLLEYLRPKLIRNPGKPVIVKTEPEAPYGAMVSVLDELRQGRKRLGLGEEIVVALPTLREAAQLWL